MDAAHDRFHWEHLLTVVNCSRSMKRVGKGAYTCPDAGGSYTHKRAKYLGAYEDKSVGRIFEVKAVVLVDRDMSGSRVKWKNVDTVDEDLRNEAEEHIRTDEHLLSEIKKKSLQVFLLDNFARTDFYKSTPGGMFESKKYFPGIAEGCKDSTELADKIRKKSWSAFTSEDEKAAT